jgi:hypothetical protein
VLLRGSVLHLTAVLIMCSSNCGVIVNSPEPIVIRTCPIRLKRATSWSTSPQVNSGQRLTKVSKRTVRRAAYLFEDPVCNRLLLCHRDFSFEGSVPDLPLRCDYLSAFPVLPQEGDSPAPVVPGCMSVYVRLGSGIPLISRQKRLHKYPLLV